MRPLVGAVVSALFLQVMHLSLSVAGAERLHKATKLQENLIVYAFLTGGVSGTGSL
ncbi:hypothetical protein PR202_gb13952 [Eleusine coracana subsp. coracana]|uniref:Uncharacterized protein n=1 Tax=Eleusine coracana subsp. coracana TaxID=191504 RepID=A0AAV5ERK6_ELECO|nr:hypothetical protein PR202_gb13952 [Eleusine coracana subsp. coracana]